MRCSPRISTAAGTKESAPGCSAIRASVTGARDQGLEFGAQRYSESLERGYRLSVHDNGGLLCAASGRGQATQLAFPAKAATIESALLEDISNEMGAGFDQSRFVPYVMMHEFEGLLFSDTDRFGQGIGRPDLSPHFQAIRDQFASPEEIDDSPLTAPSKRVKSLFEGYEKPLMGTLAALEIGLEAIRRECPLFRNWIERLEQWPA